MTVLLKRFLPNDYVESIHNVTPEMLKQHNIKGVITDLDNTLVAWDEPDATQEVIEWIQSLQSHDIQVVIISNNNEERVSTFSSPLNVSFISKARKPMQKAFNKARTDMGLNRNDVAVVGDQVLTDVFGGNRSKYYTILVVPIVKTDGFFTRFNRIVERRLLKYFRRKGYLHWED
ncbi:YqeG family HAD IIIA-type phosphatase [Alkalibacillus salilacus]|uniref:YqeG family HAD IIIA-type phosphatase n=1 Tax=Alkalibacillus salilacus TaxID=284582 RepID=UPI0027D7A061|nr:YqeG family HAD IIIA-type phosphatase [Alkalibacillus salilacus]